MSEAHYNALKQESDIDEETIHTAVLQNEEGRQDDEIRIRTERDYMIPMLQMDEQPEGIVTKYGLMRQQYLKEHRNTIVRRQMLAKYLFVQF